jgi:predicted phosphodiesterase
MDTSEVTGGHTGVRRSIHGRVRRGSFVVLLAAILAGSAGTARGQTPTITADTIVLMPDTQYYSDYDIATFKAQTRWIASQDPARMKMVIHVGDVTNDNTEPQWDRADDAMDILRNASLPFVMVPGNHDNPENGGRRDTRLYNCHFPATEFASKTGMVWTSLDGTSDNSYATFSAGGRDFMVVNLEFAPRKQKLCLANQAINDHPDRAVILATHCYQTVDGGFANCTKSYDLIGSDGNTIWHELARRHNNVQMIVSGHITSSALTRRNLVSSARALVDGPVPAGEVVEILSDFQMVPNNFTINHPFAKHGMGWMRALSFVGAAQNASEVELKTFSVLDPEDALAQLQLYTAANPGHFPQGHHPSQRFMIPATFPAHDPGELVTVHDFTVNNRSAGHQLWPRIAGNGLGDYTVVWEDSPSDNPLFQSFDIKSRRFGVDGCERRLQETINGVTAGEQRKPAVAIGQDGSKVVVWEDDNDGNGSYQILASAWESNGSPRFLDMVVNQVATGQQLRPDVAVDRQGNFIVVWQDNKDGNYDIMAARFSSLGVRIGPNDFRVNAGTAGDQLAPRVAIRRDQFSNQDGSFVIAWHDDLNTNDVFQIKAARYSAAAVKQTWPGQGGTTDRTINQFSSGQQKQPAIAIHNNTGQFVIVWQDDRNVNDLFQIKMAGFNADGSKKVWGPVVQGVREEDQTVNQKPGGDQLRPQVSMNNDGHFAVVWEDDLNDNKIFQIKVAGFRVADGARIPGVSGGPMDDQTVNANSKGQQVRPDVLLSHNGQVIVAWQDDLNDNGFGEIVAKSFMLGQPVEA